MFNQIRKHKMFRAIVAGVGIILFWRGIWHLADVTPIISNPLVSITLGLILLVVSGLLMKELL